MASLPPKKIKKKKRDEEVSLSPTLLRFMESKQPIPITGPKSVGPKAVPQDREVVWK